MANSMHETAATWLAQWHSDGVKVAAHELMYYRSKAAALARLRPRLKPGRSGALLSKVKGRGMEFDEFRHYQAGDDIRAIDWRVTARTGTPHTKLFREERERPVLLVVDFSDSMQFGSQLLLKSVQACHLASALAWLAVARGDRVGALLASTPSAQSQPQHIELRPQAREHAVTRIIQQLVAAQNQALQNWQQPHQERASVLPYLLQRTLQVAKPGTLVYVISDWRGLLTNSQQSADTAAVQALLALQRHCQLVPMQLVDPLELSLEAVAQAQISEQLALTDGQVEWQFDPHQAHQQQQYANAAAAWQQQLIQQFQQQALELWQFSAATPLESQWPGVRL
ncbi:DUF58 domain-containing protein [Pseudidiomarina fusca]|nr:DUF58 domain-containing protein [Pseudidiomarina sp. GXY010]